MPRNRKAPSPPPEPPAHPTPSAAPDHAGADDRIGKLADKLRLPLTDTELPDLLARLAITLQDTERLDLLARLVRTADWAQTVIDRLPAEQRRLLLARISAPPLAVVNDVITVVFQLLAENTNGVIAPLTPQNLEMIVRARFGLNRRDVHQRVMENWNNAEQAIRKERDKERVQPRKTEREFIAHWRRQKGDIWAEVRAYLKQHHPELAMKSGELVSIHTLQSAYSAWKKRHSEADFQEWLKTYPLAH